MGQQQLLLIVLGVILVGVAVVLGIQYFGVGAEEGAKDELVSHAMTIGANAQQYYKKPVGMGGGGNKFTGFEIPAGLDSSSNGTYTILAGGTDQSIVIQGSPVEPLGYGWTVEATVDSAGIRTVIK